MSAARMLHPGQMRLFMRPGELLGSVQGIIEAGTHPPMIRDTLYHKLTAAQRPGTAGGNHDFPEQGAKSLYESVKERGVEKPVILYPASKEQQTGDSRSEHFWLGNGHHRVASAQAAENETGKPQYIPVVYDENYMGGWRTRQHFGVSED